MSHDPSLIPKVKLPEPPKPKVFGERKSIWARFSPHYEFPISLIASCSLHVTVILVLAVFGSLLLGLRSDKQTPSIDNLIFAGGGGTPGGVGKEDAAIDLTLKEALPFDPGSEAAEPRTAPIPTPDDPLKVAPTDLAEKAPKKQTEKELTPGKGGAGREGGLGTGKGPGEGSGVGPGKENKRALRRDRWTIQIDRRAFLERLVNLQAILAVPAGDNQFRVYRDLRGEAPKSTLETLEKLNEINLMWWRNSDRIAVEALANDLELSFMPSYVAVFIPRELEDELLKQELAYKGLTEDEIADRRLETTFHAERQGERWLVTVLEQKSRR